MLFLANKFDENKFKKFLSLKDNTILDFGAGVGIWKRSNKNVRINKIFLYDPNSKAIDIAKKKYKKNKKFIFINKNKLFNKKFFYKNKINIILINSVIQYIPKEDLNKILILFKKNLKLKNWKIIITDVPIYSRIIEILLLMIFDFSRFCHAIRLIFNKDYHSTNFYKDNLDLEFLKKKFKISIYQNLNSFKFRKTIILKKF